MKYIRYFFFVLLLLIVSGCGERSLYNEPKFKSEIKGKYEILTPEDLTFGNRYISDIYVYKSYIIIVGYNSNSFVHIYDKTSGKLIRNAVGEGRGPGEMLSVMANCSAFDAESGILMLKDAMLGNKLVCNIEEMIADVPGAIVNDFCESNMMKEVASFDLNNENRLIVKNFSPTARDTTGFCRFCIKDSDDNYLTRYYNYPLPYNRENLAWWRVYNEPCLAISPDKKKLAVGISVGAILETFEIDGVRILPKSESLFIDAQIVNNKLPDHITGFADIFATNDVVYCIYDGENYALSELPNNAVRHRYVTSFTWNGKPLQKIDMGINMRRICIDESDNTLYAIANIDDEIGDRIIKYRLSK